MTEDMTGGFPAAGWQKQIRRVSIPFFSALLTGLIAHGMGLFNKYSFHDDILALFWTGTTIPSGRWMLHVIGWMETLLFGDGHFSMPLINGLFSILCIASAASLLVHTFNIRNRVYAAALGALMAAFPTVTALFGYMFTFPYYMLAMLMMTVSAVWICSGRHWWVKIPGILLGACSVGTYQAFLPMLLSILLLWDLMILSEKKEAAPVFLKRAVFQMLCVLGVLLCYLAANRFFLNKFQVELNGYMGIGQTTSTPISVFLERILRAYREFFLPSRHVNYDMYPMHVHFLYLLMVCADMLMAGRLVFSAWKENRVRALLLCLLFLLFPLGCNFIFVMSETVHGLMTFGQTMQFALFLFLLDRTRLRLPKVRRVISWAAALVLGLTGVMYVRFSNQCYLKTAFQQQQAISWFTTLVSQIKSAEGYRDDLPVAFLNEDQKADITLPDMDEMSFIHLDSYGETIHSYINSYAWATFMERWCGYAPVITDGADLRKLPEVQAMPHYPDEGSIRIIQDTVVVRF